jgi:hypothetical protein
MPLGQRSEHPPEGEVVQVVEGPRGHLLPTVIAPAPQHRVDPAQQVCERSMQCPASQPTAPCQFRPPGPSSTDRCRPPAYCFDLDSVGAGCANVVVGTVSSRVSPCS